MREEYDECIHYTLEECEGNHISVEYMCHLMSNYSLDLSLVHLIQESCRYCYERTILGCSSCECIGFRRFIVTNLWHRDMIRHSDAVYCIPDNLELGILTCSCSIEKNYIVCTLRHPARYRKRDKRSCKTKYYSIYHDSSHATTCIEDAREEHIDKKHHNREKYQYCHVRKEEEEDSFCELHRYWVIKIIHARVIICIFIQNQLDFLSLFSKIPTCNTFLTFLTYVRIKEKRTSCKGIYRS